MIAQCKKGPGWMKQPGRENNPSFSKSPRRTEEGQLIDSAGALRRTC